MRLILCILSAVALAVCAAAISNHARAAFPGLNGKIVFVSDRDGGNLEIYVMNADGSDQTRLTSNSAVDREPAWSPDGTQIVFWSNRDGDREIYKMNADGSSQTRLTYNSASDRSPSWTSDGKILFDRAPGNGLQCATGSDIYIMNVDGSNQMNLSNQAIDCVASASPTGRISFASDRDGDFELYTMNPDGSGVTQITHNPAFDFWPNWSPDGARIAFLRDEGGGDNDVYVVNADGTGELRLTNTPTRVEFSPAWSPQGDKIVFDGCFNYPSCISQIYTISPTGAGEMPLTSIGNNSKPDWQPTPPPPPPPPPPPERCVVPKVIGLRLGRARSRIRARHCSVGRVRRTRSRRVGRVISQSPKPRAVRRRGFPVKLVVGRR